jgi:hypothetical protein
MGVYGQALQSAKPGVFYFETAQNSDTLLDINLQKKSDQHFLKLF